MTDELQPVIQEDDPLSAAPVASIILPPKQLLTEKAPAKVKKVFTRADIVRSVPVDIVLPSLYPDMEPWGFILRLKFSQDAEERRQEYLALVPTEQTVKADEQNLDELCDLLVSTPTGFGDLKDDGRGPGSSFKTYVQTSDSVTKDMLHTIVRGAISLYWRKISPQEFRK